MKYVSCDLCGTSHYKVVGTRGRHNLPVRNVVCQKCGLVYTNPVMSDEELEKFYEKDYRKIYSGANPQPTPEFLQIAVTDANERLEFSKPYLKPGCRVLEVGCGTGHYLALVRDCFSAEVVGVEPGPYADYARNAFGVKVLSSFVENLHIEEGSFDVITMWHSIEHCDSPSRVLSTVRTWLVPHGLLLLELPNLRRFCTETRGAIDDTFFQNAHPFSFSDTTFSLILKKTGFYPTHIDTTSSRWRHMFFVAQPFSSAQAVGALNFEEEGDDPQKIMSLIGDSRGKAENKVWMKAKQMIRSLIGDKAYEAAKSVIHRVTDWSCD